MKNKNRYREQIIEIAMNGDGLAVDKDTNEPTSCLLCRCKHCLFKKPVNCFESRKKWLEQDTEILDEIEKSYLRNLIEPFKERVVSITKIENNPKAQSILIVYDVNKDIMPDGSSDIIILPWFAKGTMYAGMEVNKRYTLEELEL